MSSNIAYSVQRTITVEQFRDLLVASTLGERRPVSETARLEAMLKHATLLVTAWDGDLLVGVSRCLCDFSFANYCSDLAVRASHQRLGIGRELLRLSLDAGGCKLILLSAPKAVTYYPHIGLTQHPSPGLWTREGCADMGFALWIDEETAWAQGTHEYRPMGSAVISISGIFTFRDFVGRRIGPQRYDSRFSGYFASLGQMNDFLASFRKQSQAIRKKIKRHKSLVAPYF